MGYRVKFNGLDVWCEGVADLVALSNVAKSAKANTSHSQKVSSGQAKAGKNQAQVMKFLKTVAKSNGETVGGQELLEGVGVKEGAALGGVVSQAHRLVGTIGIPFDQVAIRVRRGDAKLWKAGPKIKEAIEALSAS
jgi:hypothetical protein